MSGLLQLWRNEFTDYDRQALQSDLLAGLTVAAVALPLALAFGVAAGADAAAGLVTAIVAGILIAVLGGSPFQISGPTGAMSAVLIVVASRYGLQGVWLASLMAGAVIVALGVFRLGRVVTFIPSPVITGFTSGIALIIAIGQVDAVLGLPAAPSEHAAGKLLSYLEHGVAVDGASLATALVVVLTMVLLPQVQDWLPAPARAIPASLLGIVAATALVAVLGWDVRLIGEVPRSLLLENRLTPATIEPRLLGELFVPALSIAALGTVESLLCGTVAASLTGVKLNSNVELIGQGIGNLVVPFFGGVPATAAIARTSVAIKSGARTRLTGVFHGLALLAVALLAAPLIARVPLAALGGVLIVTAMRMNEWEAIRFFLRGRHRHAVIAMAATMIATVALDLTQAIAVGVVVSVLFFLRQASAIGVSIQAVDPTRLGLTEPAARAEVADVRVVYVTGPLFFGSAGAFAEAVQGLPESARVVLSMRGVPTIDASGAQAILELFERQHASGGEVHLAGVQRPVERVLRRSTLAGALNDDRVHWSADRAILALCGSSAEAGSATGAPVPRSPAAARLTPRAAAPANR